MERYLELVEEYKEQMLDDLKGLIRIRSVVEPAEGEYPFGSGVQRALEYMLKLGAREGLETFNAENWGGHLEWTGSDPAAQTMGILVHLDVVPEGTGWSHDPYEMTEADGKIFGRGTVDDKGPALAAFYALKALKDSGYVPAKNIRLVLGLDEETNWFGMYHYLEKVKEPDFGFSPDAEFPAVHGEKGFLTMDLVKKFGRTTGEGFEIRSLSGGTAPNMVPDSARAVIGYASAGGRKANAKSGKSSASSFDYIKKAAEEYRAASGQKLSCRMTGKSMEITATGKAAHGARPELGVNAIAILMEFLGKINLANEDMNEFVDFFNRHIGFETTGASLGCAMEDAPSGALTLNAGMVHLEKQAATLTINMRYPVTAAEDAVVNGLMPAVNAFNMGAIRHRGMDPIWFPEDDPMVATYVNVYREFTGDTQTKPIVMGGGTYARTAKNCVAFGPSFPGERYPAHERDEFFEVEKLLTAAKIYAKSIYMLTRA